MVCARSPHEVLHSRDTGRTISQSQLVLGGCSLGLGKPCVETGQCCELSIYVGKGNYCWRYFTFQTRWQKFCFGRVFEVVVPVGHSS